MNFAPGKLVLEKVIARSTAESCGRLLVMPKRTPNSSIKNAVFLSAKFKASQKEILLEFQSRKREKAFVYF